MANKEEMSSSLIPTPSPKARREKWNGSQYSVCDGSVKWVNTNADGKLLDYIADRADGGTVVWE